MAYVQSSFLREQLIFVVDIRGKYLECINLYPQISIYPKLPLVPLTAPVLLFEIYDMNFCIFVCRYVQLVGFCAIQAFPLHDVAVQ